MQSPRWQRRAEDRPREICAAALDVFTEKGFAAARLDEIAKRAGVSKGTLYLYFKDKEDLFRAVVRDTVAPNVGALRDAAMASELPFAAVANMFLSRFADLAQRLPVGAVAKMVIGESGNFPELAKVWHDQVAGPSIGLLAGLIEKAQAKGEVRAGDPRLHAFTLMGPMLMGVIWREILQPVGGAPLDIEALARQHSQTVLTGLLAESEQ
ncbi:TetR/AcrR family transcriptional regulator [Sphingomonas sp. G124]|uniref:TetR/AcrR family transcriptional regulator n=1 Tax=Sphingomonas cremea TaxID=2904799 RepID=A0A9X1TWK6_9SPHN|nr:TetR/AcrR family transcriptional regulator [Sphingomonas cremea]MCF2515484.1 TetR/AcrR family transcriptional regulator [Sphingomonas cremea]